MTPPQKTSLTDEGTPRAASNGTSGGVAAGSPHGSGGETGNGGPAITRTPAPAPAAPASESLMTRERWVEVARIIGVGIVVLLYRFGIAPLPLLLVAIAVGLYPLAKTGLLDLVREHKIGTEVFVTIATVIAVMGREYIAGAVLMTIILIAEFIAELNTERARASIRSLIGSVPQTALVRRPDGDAMIPVSELQIGDVVIVRAGEKIPVDGVVHAARAFRTIKENLFVGVGVVHVLGITAALSRLIGPVQAAVIHLGPDILVFLNSVKLLRVRIDGVKPPRN